MSLNLVEFPSKRSWGTGDFICILGMHGVQSWALGSAVQFEAWGGYVLFGFVKGCVLCFIFERTDLQIWVIIAWLFIDSSFYE